MRLILIAIDGASKRNGKPDCTSCGTAWIQTIDGDLLFQSKFEEGSTSQRGELNGLIIALQYAWEHALPEEDIIIITDSQYVHNSVSYGWCYKWRRSGWINADGQDTKNSDLWEVVCELLDQINERSIHDNCVFLEWLKGHSIHYTPGNIRKAMNIDPEGLELFNRVTSVANRPADIANIIKRVNGKRKEHSFAAVPGYVALEWAIANTMADCIAYYIVNLFDKALQENIEK